MFTETVQSMSSAGSVWYVWYMVYIVCWSFKLCCEIFLLLNMVDVDRWKTVELLLNVCAAQDNCSSSIQQTVYLSQLGNTSNSPKNSTFELSHP